MEKAVVLGLGVSKQSASDALSALIVRYAELLAANGRLGMALDYLEMVPGGCRVLGGGAAAQRVPWGACAGVLRWGCSPPTMSVTYHTTQRRHHSSGPAGPSAARQQSLHSKPPTLP